MKMLVKAFLHRIPPTGQLTRHYAKSGSDVHYRSRYITVFRVDNCPRSVGFTDRPRTKKRPGWSTSTRRPPTRTPPGRMRTSNDFRKERPCPERAIPRRNRRRRTPLMARASRRSKANALGRNSPGPRGRRGRDNMGRSPIPCRRGVGPGDCRRPGHLASKGHGGRCRRAADVANAARGVVDDDVRFVKRVGEDERLRDMLREAFDPTATRTTRPCSTPSPPWTAPTNRGYPIPRLLRGAALQIGGRDLTSRPATNGAR